MLRLALHLVDWNFVVVCLCTQHCNCYPATGQWSCGGLQDESFEWLVGFVFVFVLWTEDDRTIYLFNIVIFKIEEIILLSISMFSD